MVKRALLCALLAIAVVASLAQAETYSVSAGTTLRCRLTQTISTKLNLQNDPFTATVTEPLIIGGKQIVPVGSTVDGHIAWLVRPGRIRGVGEIRLDAEKITFPDGRSYSLSTILVKAYGAEGAKVQDEEGSLKGPSSRLKDIQEIGLGMGGGGFLGTIIGGFHGAVIGGALGGAAGLADTLRRRGTDLTLPTGTQLEYQLTRELVVTADAPRQTAAVQSENIH
ncbi:MAG: hypothetical protein LAO07_11540 [Acidobacteriia bacterium]|nr:hypothetical protein [Terriglobia bacterium]